MSTHKLDRPNLRAYGLDGHEEQIVEQNAADTSTQTPDTECLGRRTAEMLGLNVAVETATTVPIVQSIGSCSDLVWARYNTNPQATSSAVTYSGHLVRFRCVPFRADT